MNARKRYEGQPVPHDLCGHVVVDLTDDGEGDDELYYSSDNEYDSS